jgi:uncharacterized protein
MLVLLSALVCADVESDLSAADEARRKGDYTTAMTIWQPLADQGDPVAAYQIGVLHDQGLGVERDTARAIAWYRKAADQGHAPALTALQTLYTPIEDPFNGQLLDPRPASSVLDQAGLMTEADRSAVDDYARRVRQHRSGGELMVVTLPGIGGAPAREYATQLFNTLRIGDADSDRGVLLLVAVADRKAELILGTGLDTPDGRATAQDIVDRHIVPNMRAGQPSTALVQGSRAAALQLLGVPLAAADGAAVQTLDDSREALQRGRGEPSAEQDDSGGFALPLSGQPVAQAAAGTGLGVGVLGMLRLWWRRRTRYCQHCRTAMVCLSEQADDIHLSPTERTEETVGSVDYDVWACQSCAQVKKLRYGALLTRYKPCPSCKARTNSSTSNTLVSATYTHGGQVRVDERCQHCNWSHTRTYSTPRLTRSNSSSGSGSRSGSSRSSGSRRSGGGRSSGGGGSGRW